MCLGWMSWITHVFRMDELDHMYDDMQDRLYEIDKNRKVEKYLAHHFF